MCQKIIFKQGTQNCQAQFGHPHAKLPVLMRDKEVTLIPWGKQKHISDDLPMGGWIQLDQIYKGNLDFYFPTPVKLPVKAFLVRDKQNNPKWFHLPIDKWIQGLLIKVAEKKCVYIVTLPPGENEFPIWPRILVG